VKRSLEPEMMDLPGQPREMLEEDLRNLRIINRYLGGSRSAVRGVAKLSARQNGGAFSLLDIGSGSGDIAAAVLGWAKNNKVTARVVALDSDPVTVKTAAVLNRRLPALAVVRADAFAPPFVAASFDFVLASQLLHHYSEEKIVRLLKNWARVARRGIIISDLVRHPLAYYGIRVLTRMFTRNVMTLTDAPLSVRRAFTIKEWRALLREADVGPFQIFSGYPFRMTALIFPKG